MSYILDALKKADQERSIGQVPDLDASHWGLRRQARRNYWIWIIVALIVLNVGLVLVLMTDDDADAPVVAGAQDGALQPEPAASVPPAMQVVPGELIVGEVPGANPPLRKRVPKPATVAPAPSRPAVVTAQPQTAPVVTASAPVAQAVTPASSLPEWAELSLEFRSRFPLPHIDVHVHDEDPKRRFIMVNLKKYREGQTLESGAQLDRINPDSIELNFDGTRFRVDR